MATGAILAGASIGASLLGTGLQMEQQRRQTEAVEAANKAAAADAAEQKKLIAAEKAEAAANRKTLIDEQRAMLGPGLGLPGITGTKYASADAVAASNVLG